MPHRRERSQESTTYPNQKSHRNKQSASKVCDIRKPVALIFRKRPRECLPNVNSRHSLSNSKQCVRSSPRIFHVWMIPICRFNDSCQQIFRLVPSEPQPQWRNSSGASQRSQRIRSASRVRQPFGERQGRALLGRASRRVADSARLADCLRMILAKAIALGHRRKIFLIFSCRSIPSTRHSILSSRC